MNYVRNENRFELREPLRSFITSIKNIFNADACALYLIAGDEMDELEKKQEFIKRFPNGINVGGKKIKKNDLDKYKILKFIGVDDLYSDSKHGFYSLWDFNYKERPNKYIVFHKCPINEPIDGEGITGMSARLKKIYCFEGEGIDGNKARHHDNDTERKIHPKCDKVLAIPIIHQDNVVGVIRLDIYEIPNRNKRSFNTCISDKQAPKECDEFVEKGTKTQSFQLINELCKEIIAVSNKNSVEQSYSRLFSGENILDSIKALKKDKHMDLSVSEKNNELYRLIEHLFFVFKRHTYIGFDEILKRVMYFIKDLFDLLDMEDYYGLIESKLKEFKDHEQLMLYGIEKYRDHFMHQFHVFIFGYILLNYLGIEKIKKTINKKLKNTSEFNKVAIDNDGVLRMWILMSFFHDITYIFEEYEDKMQNFIKHQLKASIPVHINWGSMLSETGKEITYMDWLQKIVLFFESPKKKNSTNKVALFRNYVQALQYNQDHGVLSSLLLTEIFIPHINDKIQRGKFTGNEEKANQRIAEVYLAALAISFHNSCVFYSLKERSDLDRLSFESFPFEFLLMYCDTAQEWGRKKDVDKKFYAAPVLESIDLTHGNKKAVVCNLHYCTDQHPGEEKLKGFVKEKLLKYSAKKATFKIRYSYETGKKPTRFCFPHR